MRMAIATAAIMLGLGNGAAQADEVADFYKGRTVQVVVGYGTGGGYDVYARLVAKYIGRHIPGNPATVVQNMPGAGSLVAANFLYNIAPKDGTTFGIFARNMPLLGILGGNPAVQFDARKFTWLGSSSSFEEDAYPMFVRKDAQVKSLEEAMKAGGPVIVLGGTGEGATGNDVPILLRDALGLNIRMVAGYRDSNALFLAIERGEIDGRTTDFSSVKTHRPHWLEPGSEVHMLLQFARKTRHPELPNVPTARELAKDDRARQLIEIAELPYIMARPFAGPPGIPPARVKALQAAFGSAHADPALLAEADKLRIGITPLPGAEVVPLIERLAASPPELLDYIRKLQSDSK